MPRDEYARPAYDSHRGCRTREGSPQLSKDEYAAAEDRLYEMIDTGRTLPTAAQRKAEEERWERAQLRNHGPVLYEELTATEQYFVRLSFAKKHNLAQIPVWGKAKIELYNQRVIARFNEEHGNAD